MYKFFTVDFFHSDLSFDCLNNLFCLQFAICPEFRVTILSVMLFFFTVFPFVYFFTYSCYDLLVVVIYSTCFDSSLRFVLYLESNVKSA